MDWLAAIRPSVDRRASYDVISHANLINTVKYSQLYDALWDAVVSVPDREFSQLRHVDDAAKTLVYANTIYQLWLTGAWRSVYHRERLTGGPLGPWLGPTMCKQYFDFCEAEFEWTSSHKELIDAYAVQGTRPTFGLFIHFFGVKEQFDGNIGFEPDISRPSDIKVLRNLHRFMDAVTLYTYWTVMQAYELWGERLMTQRIGIALHDDRFIKYLGTLSTLPKACLDNIHKHL